MGSLFSTPKAPQPVRVQYVTAPTTSSSNSSSSGAGSASTDTQDTSSVSEGLTDKEASEIRAENIARRSRGRSGTVRTGFTGLLSTNAITPSRKSLLGE